MAVKSVYNFVPAPDEKDVFKPDWADQVSHDIPFSDGESGEIELKITAETPIFIRNGHSKEDEQAFKHYLEEKKKNKNHQPTEKEQERIDRYLSFSNYKGEYFIPATSLKGMFRNVLEIMSFSRMIQTEGISINNPITYGLRDMNNPDYSGVDGVRNAKSGWLMQEDGKWVIKPCINHKISLQDIEKEFSLPSSLKEISGKRKNELCMKNIKDEKYKFSFNRDLGKWVGKQYAFNKDGDFEGYIVMYGDIENKKYDYIFSEPNSQKFSVDDKLIKNLDNIESSNEDSSWNYFRKNYSKIPVFFKAEEGSKVVKHFGLTKLYRLNNSHHLSRLTPLKGYLESPEFKKPDLTELIFGNVRVASLKGRVFISNAFTRNAVAGERIERVLNSPKPSFYPAYIKQEGRGGILKDNYKTYHNDDSELRGLKRYPAHLNKKPNIETDNENIASELIPLNEGAIFNGKIRYHNLRPTEIGALVSAITFHGNSDKFFHSLGGAKPYGFGKVKVEVIKDNGASGFMKHFEMEINKHLGRTRQKNFVEHEAIREMLSIASNPKNDRVNELLKYPLLEVRINGKKENEFNNYKQAREYLEDYSERNGTFLIKTQIDEEFYKKVKKSEIEAKKKEIEMFNNAIKSKSIGSLKQFVSKYPNSENSQAAKDHIIVLEKKIEQEEIKTQQEKEYREKQEAARKEELSAGINLNGVTKNKTIDGLMRTLKRWTESLNGSIDDATIAQIKNRFSELYKKLKPKEEEPWKLKLKSELPKLSAYLNSAQMTEVQAYLNEIS